MSVNPEPFNFSGKDADIMMGALANYEQTLRRVHNGAKIYAPLIARTNAMYRDLYRLRYGFDFPSKNEVN